MFRKGKLFIIGVVYFVVMFALNKILPASMGAENGVIENLQLLWFFAGFYQCYRLSREKLPEWGGWQQALWYAGMIFFFLVTMREISWGRTFLLHPDGRMYEYKEMGLYGKMVHPMVGILIAAFLYLCYKAKIWIYLKLVKLPSLMLGQTLLFVVCQWLAEHKKTSFFKGDLAEELAEFGAYMMVYFLLLDLAENTRKLKTKE